MPRESVYSAFLRGYGGEGRDELMNVLPAAVWALDFGLVDLGYVMVLGEFPVAVFAMVGVLRHGVSPRQHDSADPRRCL